MSIPPPQSPEPDDGFSITPDVPADAFEPSEPGDADITRMTAGIDVRSIALVGLFIIAVVFSLSTARGFLLPIAVAILLDFLLSPVVRWLRRFKIAEPVSAALVLLTLLGAMGATAYNLAAPAAQWMQRGPAGMAEVRRKFETIRRPMERVTQAAEEVQNAAGQQSTTPTVKVEGQTFTSRIFGGTLNMLAFVLAVLFLTYFLLASGDLFLQKLIRVLPQFKDKKRAVSIAREIEAQVSTYILSTTAVNIGLGIVTAIAMWLLGLPNPALWGLVVALLNYMPYIGAIASMGLLGLAALLTFDTVGRALLVPGVFWAINMVESNLVTPLILSHRLKLNTVALFIGMTFWWFVWGIPGALMAVPMMAVIKIFCDHFDSLAPVGEFLGS